MAGFKFGGLYLEKKASSSTPSADHISIIALNDGKVYSVDENGNETLLNNEVTLAQIQDISADVESNTANISNAYTYIDSVNARVDELSASVSSISAYVSTIEDNVKLVQNNDVDTGTETVDAVTMSTGSVWWDVVKRKDNNIRTGTIIANVVNNTVEWSSVGFTKDIGNTNGLSFNVTYSGGQLILQATATTDNWDVRAFRRAITY